MHFWIAARLRYEVDDCHSFDIYDLLMFFHWNLGIERQRGSVKRELVFQRLIFHHNDNGIHSTLFGRRNRHIICDCCSVYGIFSYLPFWCCFYFETLMLLLSWSATRSIAMECCHLINRISLPCQLTIQVRFFVWMLFQFLCIPKRFYILLVEIVFFHTQKTYFETENSHVVTLSLSILHLLSVSPDLSFHFILSVSHSNTEDAMLGSNFEPMEHCCDWGVENAISI